MLRLWNRLTQKLKNIVLSRRLLRWIGNVGGIRWASHFLAAQTDWGTYHPDKLTVLCITRSRFSKDIEQLKLNTELNWVTLRSLLLGRIQAAWVPSSMHQQIYFSSTQNDEYETKRQQVEDFAVYFLKHLQKKHQIDAVMSAHVNYWQDVGIIRACAKLGIPFLALCQEHFVIPSGQTQRIERYQKANLKFHGAGAAVFGPVTGKVFIEGGVCKEHQIHVTGAPRFDQWRNIDINDFEQNNITLLSYSGPTYLAQQNFKEVLNIFAKASQNTKPSVRFVVKCKDGKDVETVQNMLHQHPQHQVEIELTMPLYELLPSSRLVIGLNSLALLETLFTKAIIAIPNWCDAQRKPEERMIDPSNSVAASVLNFVDNGEALNSLIQSVLKENAPSKNNQDERMLLFQQYFHFHELKTCSEIVVDFVEHYVGQLERKS